MASPYVQYAALVPPRSNRTPLIVGGILVVGLAAGGALWWFSSRGRAAGGAAAGGSGGSGGPYGSLPSYAPPPSAPALNVSLPPYSTVSDSRWALETTTRRGFVYFDSIDGAGRGSGSATVQIGCPAGASCVREFRYSVDSAGTVALSWDAPGAAAVLGELGAVGELVLAGDGRTLRGGSLELRKTMG